MHARGTACFALAIACGPYASPPRVTLTSPVAHAAPPTAALAPDLLRCPLHVETYELGENGDGAPSAPVAAHGGFVVAFVHGPTVMTQELDDAGALHDPVAVGAVHTATPLLVVDHDAPMAVTRELPGLAGAWPDDAAAGPSGLVATALQGGSRVVLRAGRVVATFPVSPTYPMPTEQVLASGAAADVVVLRGASFRVGVVPERGASVVHELGAPAFVDVSIAGGPRGFLVVGDGPNLQRLTVIALDRNGAPSAPADLPAEADSKVTRFPRAAPLAEGWVVTYWDGIGPSLVRIDGAARETSPPLELRTGDERGGQTEARIVVTKRAIAVTWMVTSPWFGHGVAEEIPKRPGPRLAVLTCR